MLSKQRKNLRLNYCCVWLVWKSAHYFLYFKNKCRKFCFYVCTFEIWMILFEPLIPLDIWNAFIFCQVEDVWLGFWCCVWCMSVTDYVFCPVSAHILHTYLLCCTLLHVDIMVAWIVFLQSVVVKRLNKWPAGVASVNDLL